MAPLDFPRSEPIVFDDLDHLTLLILSRGRRGTIAPIPMLRDFS
jgi:hypothetical protein